VNFVGSKLLLASPENLTNAQLMTVLKSLQFSFNEAKFAKSRVDGLSILSGTVQSSDARTIGLEPTEFVALRVELKRMMDASPSKSLGSCIIHLAFISKSRGIGCVIEDNSSSVELSWSVACVLINA
jgi:hypothetical protein